MTAALYARVSTAGQERDQTIDSQIAEIEHRANSDGNKIDDKLKFVDDGWSGSLLARPGLDQLRDAVKSRSFDTLYLYDLGRLSRDFLNQLILKKELIESGIRIISLHDVNGDKPEDMFAQNVMGLFHDYERLKIAERFRRGKLHKSGQGILFGWEAPYGYQYTKESGVGSFIINEQEAKIIKTIFSWVGDEGITVRQVIKRLFDMGITPRKSKSGHWSTSTLSKRLRDQTYIGTTFYNKTVSVEPKKPLSTSTYKRIKKSSRKWKAQDEWKPIAVPSIISKELFDKVQLQLIENGKFATRNKKNNYMLSGVISCTCGCTRAGEGITGTNNLYYRCTDRIHRFPLPKKCKNKGVNAPFLDTIVWAKLSSLLANPQRVKVYYKRWKQEKLKSSSKPTDGVNSIEKMVNSLTEQDKRYLYAYGSGAITLTQYKELSKQIKLKIEAYTSKFDTPKKVLEEKPLAIPDFKAICDKMNTILDKQVFEKRRHIIQKLSVKVVTDGTTATLFGSLPITTDTDFSQENIKYEIEHRYCRSSKRRKKHSF